MKIVKVYYNDESENEAKTLLSLVNEIAKEEKDMNKQISDFSNHKEMIEKYSLYKFPAMVINDKVISKVELRGKGYNYIKEYIKGIICDG